MSQHVCGCDVVLQVAYPTDGKTAQLLEKIAQLLEKTLHLCTESIKSYKLS